MSKEIMYKVCGWGEANNVKGLVFIVEIDPVREGRIAEIEEKLKELKPTIISTIGERPVCLFCSSEQNRWDRNYMEKRRELAPRLVDELERLLDDKGKTTHTYVKVGCGPFVSLSEPFAEIPDSLVPYEEFMRQQRTTT